MKTCLQSTSIEVADSAVLCSDVSTWAVRIKDYGSPPFELHMPLDPCPPMATPWEGKFAFYNDNIFGTGGCSYQVGFPPPCVLGVVFSTPLTNGYVTNVFPGHVGEWWIVLVAFDGVSNVFIWTGKKLTGSDPLGIYDLDTSLFGPTMDSRPTIELEAYNTAP